MIPYLVPAVFHDHGAHQFECILYGEYIIIIIIYVAIAVVKGIIIQIYQLTGENVTLQ